MASGDSGVKAVITSFKLKLPATRAQVTPCWHRAFSLQKQRTQRVAAIAMENPTSNVQRASRLATQQENFDNDKMDKMAVDRWQLKPATELPVHVLTILDMVDQQVRTKPSVTTELSEVC